ncbi:sensor histidine kinase [Micromonospora sp. NPDC050397]|uniref:sensor histidine kinase n=1 Tax=Micromonospora sp. NPDC050397 TaxID=3364279 RepID=UPI00384BC940
MDADRSVRIPPLVPLGAEAVTPTGPGVIGTGAAIPGPAPGPERASGPMVERASGSGPVVERDRLGTDPFGWWRRTSQPQRFDIYTRSSLYFMMAMEPFLLVLGIGPELGSSRKLLVLFCASLLHSVSCLVLLRAGLAHALAARARPTLVAIVAAVLTGAYAVTAVLVLDEEGTVRGLEIVAAFIFYGALSVAFPLRTTIWLGTLGIVLLNLLLWLDGVPPFGLVGFTVALVAVFVGALMAFRLSLWMIDLIWQLERSRSVQARLAVAEERLRFARDLHDVLGRNLSIVALKSELAAQLARRGRPEAVQEMLEVRRVAQESLSEVREVVRGYRKSALDLDAELAGARSVLGSAGIECRVNGEGRGLPEQVRDALGWVVREGATNALRHSDARTCVIRLAADGPAAVVFTMENDGVRGDPEPGAPVLGAGLAGLAERVTAVGGTVLAEHRPGNRFLLTARMSVPAPARNGEGEA